MPRNKVKQREAKEREDEDDENGKISEKKAFHKAEKEDEALHKVVTKAMKKVAKK